MKDFSSIVVSSKIKLHRNLNGFVFPSMLEGDEGVKVLNKVADKILKLNSTLKLYKIKTLPELDANLMLEKGLVSSNLIDDFNYGAVILSSDENVSIMINEEDHIVEECRLGGLSLLRAYEGLEKIDDAILPNFNISFDGTLGFLTSNLNLVGTGLQASVELFLPGLSITNKIDDMISLVKSQGFEINKFVNVTHPEYVFEISNKTTLGLKENEIVVKLTELVIKLCDFEIKSRQELLTFKYFDDVKDIVFRSWGILTNCFKISSEECLKYLSNLKIGVALDLMRFKNVDVLDKLLVDTLPYSLTKISNSKVANADLDKFRATFVSNVLKSKRIK